MTDKSVNPGFLPRAFCQDLENWFPFGLGVQIGLGDAG